jgi:hypothetical protein
MRHAAILTRPENSRETVTRRALRIRPSYGSWHRCSMRPVLAWRYHGPCSSSDRPTNSGNPSLSASACHVFGIGAPCLAASSRLAVSASAHLALRHRPAWPYQRRRALSCGIVPPGRIGIGAPCLAASSCLAVSASAHLALRHRPAWPYQRRRALPCGIVPPGLINVGGPCLAASSRLAVSASAGLVLRHRRACTLAPPGPGLTD